MQSKEEKYKQILIEIKSLVQHENDLIANLANISAVLERNICVLVGWILFS